MILEVLKKRTTLLFFLLFIHGIFLSAQDSINHNIQLLDTPSFNKQKVDTTYIDSIGNTVIRTINYSKDGRTHSLIYIDDTSNNKKGNLIWYTIASLLIIILLFTLFVYYRKRKKSHDVNPLTEQEQNIVNLITSGKTNVKIAEELFISISTVKTHVNNIYRKLGISSRDELKDRFLGK